MTAPLADRFAAAQSTLDAIGQAQVLRYYDTLDDAGKDQLLTQIEGIDWDELARLIESHVKQQPTIPLPEVIEPAPTYPASPTADLEAKYTEAHALGEQLIRDGQVAAFCVAGGQGTRLGWDGPKGTFPGTPLREAPLFQVFAEYLLGIKAKYGTDVPLYLMTSDVNDADTRAFFEQNHHFGLDPANVMIFPQAMMPAMDMTTGDVLLADPASMALSPNGHGGSLKALHTSGAIADMKTRGITQVSYIQVDNPLVRVVDPLFIGLHALDHAQMSSKMIPKAGPLEKVGNFCLADGKVTVIEYSNLPDALALSTNDDGSLKFNAGSIAIHVIAVDFVEQLNAQGFGLPWNRAEKKVPHLDADGNPVKPTEPNAVKLETFVFDALPLCDTSIVYETLREDEFGPVKNASGDGVKDSPDTSKQLQSDRAAKWLTAAGVTVAPGTTCEISQALAVSPDDLKQHDLPDSIEGDYLLA
ncbi:MAG: UDPGP type 1 family protein [Planctomycetota bacterium]